MKNPKALAVFQEWIAANCIKGEAVRCFQNDTFFIIAKMGHPEIISLVGIELSTGKIVVKPDGV